MKELHFGYELFKGSVWVSKQDKTQKIQGSNIAIIKETGPTIEVKVLAYVIRKGSLFSPNNAEFKPLNVIVWSILKSYGWTDEYCNELLTTGSNLTKTGAR